MSCVPSDSAGTPWAGRTVPSAGFEGDTGAADPALVAALAERAAAPSAAADARVLELVRTARWIVPIVAVAAELDAGADGHAVEKSTDMAVVTVTGPDGRRALPVFTGTSALAEWDQAARPVPLTAARAAQAAIAEGCQLAVVDLGSALAAELRPSMVWALAHGAEWLPAHADPLVQRSVLQATMEEPAVVAHRVEEGRPLGSGVLRVVLVVRPGLDATGIHALATGVGERLARDGEFRARVDELAFSIERA